MLTTYKVVRALKSLKPGTVSAFIERHGLPARTVHRLRDSKRGNTNGGHTPRESTIRAIAAALAKDGVLSEQEATAPFKRSTA